MTNWFLAGTKKVKILRARATERHQHNCLKPIYGHYILGFDFGKAVGSVKEQLRLLKLVMEWRKLKEENIGRGRK